MTVRHKLRILILSAGTEVGQNLLAALAHRRPEMHIVATSSVANEPALFHLDTVYLAPETAADPAGFEARFLAVMAAEAIDLAIPCRDHDVAFLAGLGERRPDLAPRLLCGSLRAAQIIGDKWASHLFSKEHGLPFAPCLVACSDTERRAFIAAQGLPLVAKPRRGYAGIGVALLYTEQQVAAALADGDYLVQQYLGDRDAVAGFLARIESRGVPLYHSFERVKHSIQALIAPDGAIVHVICTLNERFMRRSKVVRPDPDPTARDIGEHSARAFAAIGWRGPLNVQCEKDAQGAIRIHEFNGRFTGGTVDRWLLGYDEVGAAIAAFTGQTPPPAQPMPASVESFQSRTARAANPREVALLARDGVWRREP